MSNQTETVTDLTRIRYDLPEAWYHCQQVENGLITASNHPMHPKPGDGMYQNSELWYAHFDVQEYNSRYGGFWCGECLEKLKLPKGISLFEHLTGKA